LSNGAFFGKTAVENNNVRNETIENKDIVNNNIIEINSMIQKTTSIRNFSLWFIGSK